jgi:hypothetical protein
MRRNLAPLETSFTGAVIVAAALVSSLSCGPPSQEHAAPIEIVSAVGGVSLPAGWQGIDIGAPGAAGSDAYAAGAFTITGAGAGIGVGGNTAPDALHFTYTPVTGDFTLIARISSFNGTTKSAVGLMVRQDLTATSPGGGIFFQPAFTPGAPAPNQTAFYDRDPAGRYRWKSTGTATSISPPFYMKMVRLGHNFAVYRSSNGTRWSQAGANQSGGSLSSTGAVQVGFFVASGTTSAAQATIDGVTLLGGASMPYETSWVGNSFVADDTGYVSGTAAALYVAPDGTCVTNGFYDEAGEPAKIYKDGAIVKRIDAPPGGGFAYEGSVTGDGTFLYLFGRYSSRQAGIFRTNMHGDASSNVPIFFAHAVMDAYPVGKCQVSGLAAGNGELYVSNPITNKVLVANPSQSMYFTGANNSFNTISAAAISTAGITNPAPQAVYQSMREADSIPYSLPGFDPAATYSVRLHFAVLNTAAVAGTYIGQLSVAGRGGQSVTNFDPFVQAGGEINKASVVQFDGVMPDSSGNILVTISKAATALTMIVNGIEIVGASGVPIFQLNAGGGLAGAWKSDVHEIVSRAFPITRPGPIAVDKRGTLWIVQEGTAFPASGNFTSTPGWAAIKAYNKNGQFLFKQITDVVSPTALAYDPAQDRLLVAENGPDQNIRIYTNLTGTPMCTSTFGQKGGVFAGPTPGVVYDTTTGSYARFYGPSGVGVDAGGNIYVASNNGQSDLRAFSPSGATRWTLFALDFTNTGDFDPIFSSAPEVYTTTKHYKINYDPTGAGQEWSLYSYLWNPLRYGPNPRPNSSAVIRRVGAPGGPRVLYSSGQGLAGYVGIFRFDGEQIVPSGRLDTAGRLWIDGNGDGVEQANEDTVAATGAAFASFDVDATGNIYLATTSLIREVKYLGLGAAGVPQYSVAPGSYADTPLPAPFNAGVTLERVRYVAADDAMYIMAATNPTNPNDGSHEYTSSLARYDRWSTGTPVRRFAMMLPTPATDPNFMYAKPYPFNLSFQYDAMDVANGRVFASELWGPIHVFDGTTGAAITVLVPGPEVGGDNAWQDENMGVRVNYNSVFSEYDVLSENSGFRAHQNFFRWNGSP